MKVTVSLEQRFVRTPDQHIWSLGAFSYSFWRKYLGVFDSVNVVARVADIENPTVSLARADGDGVSFSPVPDYRGPAEYLRVAPRALRAVKAAAAESQAVVLRGGSFLAGLLRRDLARHQPFGVEVVADPFDIFGPGAQDHILRPIFRHWFTADLKRQCKEACAAAYVTRRSLQRRYPCPSFMISYSDVELGPKDFVSVHRPESCSGPLRNRTLVTISSMAQMYKGVDVLIRALKLCKERSPTISLVIIGEGKCRPKLERLARSLNVVSSIRFTGHIQERAQILHELDLADLFVLASRAEGLPRAMVEAMARAIPCIGSRVGGIPELLDEDCLVEPNDPDALAQRVLEVLGSPKRLARMSATNLARARQFDEDQIAVKRTSFLHTLRETTERAGEFMRIPFAAH